MEDCVFCKIARDRSRKFYYESAGFVVFESIDPKAKTHLIIVTREHIRNVVEISNELWLQAREVALTVAKNIDAKSFRLVVNAGGALEVKHFHLHFLAPVALDREI